MKTYRSPCVEIQLSEEGVSKKIQLFRTGTFFHSVYGKFDITAEHLQAMEKNFREKVRGIDIAVDYKHASQDIAAGWIKNVYLAEGGTELWADVEWTPAAEKVLAEKEFRYISPDFAFDYQDNETLKKFGPVLLGAGLTNRPTIKQMEPVVELSEGKPIDTKGIKTMDYKTMDPAMLDKMTPEQLKAALVDLLAKMKAKDSEAATAGEELVNAEKKAAEMAKQCSELKKQIQLVEKNTQFEKLLSEGKAVPAQKDAFLSGDMAKFIELQGAVKFSEQGHGTTPAAPATGKFKTREEAEAEVIRLAEVKVKENKAPSLEVAFHMVLSENKELNEKLYS
jgi:phage I-like protein